MALTSSICLIQNWFECRYRHKKACKSSCPPLFVAIRKKVIQGPIQSPFTSGQTMRSTLCANIRFYREDIDVGTNG